MIDNVNNPPHYKAQGAKITLNLEPIDILKELTFCKGNAIKYILRHRHKNGLEDLKKAEYYIKADTEIARPSGIETLVITEYLKELLNTKKITIAEFRCILKVLVNPEEAQEHIKQLILNYGTPLKEAVDESLKNQEQRQEREFDPIAQLIETYKDFI